LMSLNDFFPLAPSFWADKPVAIASTGKSIKTCLRIIEIN
jgi:hypothetical protein